MTMHELHCVMRGVALRNGKQEAEAPSDDDFFADLAASMAEGTA